jgi:hypothetical protein
MAGRKGGGTCLVAVFYVLSGDYMPWWIYIPTSFLVLLRFIPFDIILRVFISVCLFSSVSCVEFVAWPDPHVIYILFVFFVQHARYTPAIPFFFSNIP